MSQELLAVYDVPEGVRFSGQNNGGPHFNRDITQVGVFAINGGATDTVQAVREGRGEVYKQMYGPMTAAQIAIYQAEHGRLPYDLKQQAHYQDLAVEHARQQDRLGDGYFVARVDEFDIGHNPNLRTLVVGAMEKVREDGGILRPKACLTTVRLVVGKQADDLSLDYLHLIDQRTLPAWAREHLGARMEAGRLAMMNGALDYNLVTFAMETAYHEGLNIIDRNGGDTSYARMGDIMISRVVEVMGKANMWVSDPVPGVAFDEKSPVLWNAAGYAPRYWLKVGADGEPVDRPQFYQMKPSAERDSIITEAWSRAAEMREKMPMLERN